MTCKFSTCLRLSFGVVVPMAAHEDHLHEWLKTLAGTVVVVVKGHRRVCRRQQGAERQGDMGGWTRPLCLDQAAVGKRTSLLTFTFFDWKTEVPEPCLPQCRGRHGYVQRLAATSVQSVSVFLFCKGLLFQPSRFMQEKTTESKEVKVYHIVSGRFRRLYSLHYGSWKICIIYN